MNNFLGIDEQKGLIKTLNIVSKICFFIMLILAVSPIVGLYIPISTVKEFSNLWFVRSLIVRVSGLVCLALSFFILVIKTALFGKKYIFETLIKNPWNLLFLLTLVWGCLSLIIRVDNYEFGEALFGWAYTYEGFLGYISYAGIYLGCSAIRNNKQKKIILNTLIITSVVIAVFTLLSERGILNYAFYRNGLCFSYSGAFINPNHYGYYLCVMSIVSGAYAIVCKEKKLKPLYMVAFFLNTMVLILNNSFGGYLALLVGIIFLNFWFIKKKENLIYVLGIDVFFFGMTFTVNPELFTVELVGFFQGIFQFIGNLFSGSDASAAMQEITSVTADGRASAWSTAITAIKDSPLFGWGPDREVYVFKFKYGELGATHNEYLHAGVCMGIPAMAFYLGAIVWLIVRSFRRLKKCSDLEKVFMLGFGVYAVSACFGITIPICEFIFFMMLGLVNSFHAKEKEELC